MNKRKRKLVKNRKINNRKYKIITVISVLITCVILIIFSLIFHKEQPSIPEYKESVRVDISHTYQKLEDGTYKIYPAHVSLVSYDQDKIRFEYAKSKLVWYGYEMEATDSQYQTDTLASAILELPLSEQLQVKVATSLEGGTTNNNIKSLREQWSLISAKGTTDTKSISDYILNIVIEDGQVCALSIKNYDVNNQDITKEYPVEYARDSVTPEEAEENAAE